MENQLLLTPELTLSESSKDSSLLLSDFLNSNNYSGIRNSNEYIETKIAQSSATSNVDLSIKESNNSESFPYLIPALTSLIATGLAGFATYKLRQKSNLGELPAVKDISSVGDLVSGLTAKKFKFLYLKALVMLGALNT